jgi:anti-anti-sigma factor
MTVEPTPHDDAVRVLRATGELDVRAVPQMPPRLAALVAGAQGVILDLTAVTFFDSSGVRLVDQPERECGRTGAPLRVVAPPGGSSRRVLELVGVATLIVSDDLPTALASLRHWPTTQAVPDGPRRNAISTRGEDSKVGRR